MTHTTLGSRIELAMETAGINQRQLALRVGVSSASINRYITGEREPKLIVLNQIAKALNTKVSELVDDPKIIPNQVGDAVRIVARSASELTDSQRFALIRALSERETTNDADTRSTL